MDVIIRNWPSFLLISILLAILAFIFVLAFSQRKYAYNYAKADLDYWRKYGYKDPKGHPEVLIIIFLVLAFLSTGFHLFLYFSFIKGREINIVEFIINFIPLLLVVITLIFLIARQNILKTYHLLTEHRIDKYQYRENLNVLLKTRGKKDFSYDKDTNWASLSRRKTKLDTSNCCLYILFKWSAKSQFYNKDIIKTIELNYSKMVAERSSLITSILTYGLNFTKRGTYKRSLFTLFSEMKMNMKKAVKECKRYQELDKKLDEIIEVYNQKNLDLVKYDAYDELLSPFFNTFTEIKERYDKAIANDFKEQIDALETIEAPQTLSEISDLLDKICFIKGGEQHIDELDLTERSMQLKSIDSVLREYEPNTQIIDIVEGLIDKDTPDALEIDTYYYSFFDKYDHKAGEMLEATLDTIIQLQDEIKAIEDFFKDHIVEFSMEVRSERVSDLEQFVRNKYDYNKITKLVESINKQKRELNDLLNTNFDYFLKEIIEAKDYEILDLYIKENKTRILSYKDDKNNNFLHLLIPDNVDYLYAISDEKDYQSLFFESNNEGVVPLDYLDKGWLDKVIDVNEASIDLDRLKINSKANKAENIAYAKKYLAYVRSVSSYTKQGIIDKVDLDKVSGHEYETIVDYMHKAAYQRFDASKTISNLAPYREYLSFHFSTLYKIYEKMINNINNAEFEDAKKRSNLIKKCSGLFISQTLKRLVKDYSIKAKEGIIVEPSAIEELLEDIYYVSSSSVSETLKEEIVDLTNTALTIAKRLYENDPKESLFDAIANLDKDFKSDNSWYDEYLAILGLSKPVTIEDIKRAYYMKMIALRNAGAPIEEINALNAVYNRLLRQ